VVADEHDVAVAPLEGAHAVVAAGQEGAVVECDGCFGVVERAVPEAFRHVQTDDAVAQVRDGVDKLDVRSVRSRGAGRVAGDEPEERAAEKGATRRRGRAPQQLATIDVGHGGLLRPGPNPSILRA
jgi:hypothetical protein